jgi:ligand-binding sensor domain-containing protein
VEGVDGGPWRWIANSRGVTMLASLTSIAVSVDAGKSWRTVQLPAKLAQVGAIAVDDQDELWVGGREGVFLSMDRGTSWTTLNGLNVSDVNSIYFDGRQGRVLITANASTTMAFGVSLANKAVKYWDTGWNLRFMRPVGDYLIGATLFDGIVVQPRMVQSK